MRRALTLPVLAAAALAGCVISRPVPPAPSPNDVCLALQESLNAAVPAGESLADLLARGARVKTPLTFAPGTASQAQQPSGAVVRMLIAPDGSVAPGSPRTLKSVGEVQLAQAVEAAALSMSFEFDAAARPVAPIPFTATFALCQAS